MLLTFTLALHCELEHCIMSLGIVQPIACVGKLADSSLFEQ